MIPTLATAWVSGAWACWRLSRTPEPDDGLAEGDDLDPSSAVWVKPAYVSIVTRWFVLVAMLAATALAALAGATIEGWALQVGWGALAGGGCVLALCDLRTTYLPNTLMRPLAALVAAACLAQALAVGVHSWPQARTFALRVALSVAIAWFVFWLLWRLGAGMGFGDVRLVAVLAAAASAVSLSTWWTGLLLGTLLGAVWGVAVTISRRRRPSALGAAFAYGPALFLGAWLGLLLGVV